MLSARRLALLLMIAVFSPLAGCMTPRMHAKMDQFPRNRVFRTSDLREIGEQGYVFGEYDQGGEQSLCLLELAPDAKLSKRYHASHDMTLFVVQGNAIVQVEETRYFVSPGDAVLLPHYTAYAIMPNKTEKPFAALMVFSPPYDKNDVHIEK